jgi:hypothetical protein
MPRLHTWAVTTYRKPKAPTTDGARQLLESIRSRQPIEGLTHSYYRYPASFHPQFSRSVIEALSRPGDTVLDPFMGGGTTVVEALRLGRRVIGVDINPLAVFTARVKCTPLSQSQLRAAHEVMKRLRRHPPRIHLRLHHQQEDARFKNAPWWIRNCLLGIMEEFGSIKDDKVERFLRCGLLKAAKWALDCKRRMPNSRELVASFCANVAEMCDQMKEYRQALSSTGLATIGHAMRHRTLLQRSAIGIENDHRIPSAWLPVRLVVTSPPYPGVHVLYHRWQVRGRRETAAPFAIVGSPDGQGPSYYTFAHRYREEPYFDALTAAYKSIASLLAPDALVVQMVSFADPGRQLKKFLAAMARAGFEECTPADMGLRRSKRIWRLVPGRRWYSWCKDDPPTAKELVLFHRLKHPC